MNTSIWTGEYLSEGEKHCHKIIKHLYSKIGNHHKLEIVETANYGRGLFLDDRIQHVEYDEYIYSESITHPIGTLLGDKLRHVLVVGGGPGGAIREILKHRSVETVIQVEIDEGIIQLTKEYFTHISNNYHDDPRVKIIIADIRDFIVQCTTQYDLIIYDVSEPLENSPAENVFNQEILHTLRDHLSEHGAFISWAGSGGPRSNSLSRKISQNMKIIFPFVTHYLCHTQSYGTSWIFAAGTLKELHPLNKTMNEIDQTIQKNISAALRLYDGMTHHHMFLLPKDIREAFL